MARLTAADWLSRLRAKGWTRDQIRQATGASPSTQQRLQSGRQKTSRYETAIKETGAKYSRRKTVPPEYPRRAPLDKVVADLWAVDLGVGPTTADLEDLKDRFGTRGRLAILRGQLKAIRVKMDTGHPAQPSWYFVEGPELMERYAEEGDLFDPYMYLKQLYYGARS